MSGFRSIVHPHYSSLCNKSVLSHPEMSFLACFCCKSGLHSNCQRVSRYLISVWYFWLCLFLCIYSAAHLSSPNCQVRYITGLPGSCQLVIIFAEVFICLSCPVIVASCQCDSICRKSPVNSGELKWGHIKKFSESGIKR